MNGTLFSRPVIGQFSLILSSHWLIRKISHLLLRLSSWSSNLTGNDLISGKIRLCKQKIGFIDDFWMFFKSKLNLMTLLLSGKSGTLMKIVIIENDFKLAVSNILIFKSWQLWHNRTNLSCIRQKLMKNFNYHPIFLGNFSEKFWAISAKMKMLILTS